MCQFWQSEVLCHYITLHGTWWATPIAIAIAFRWCLTFMLSNSTNWTISVLNSKEQQLFAFEPPPPPPLPPSKKTKLCSWHWITHHLLQHLRRELFDGSGSQWWPFLFLFTSNSHMGDQLPFHGLPSQKCSVFWNSCFDPYCCQHSLVWEQQLS